MVSTHPVCTATISRFNSHLGEWGWEVGSWTWEEMVWWQPCYSRWPWTKGRMQNCCRQSVLYAFQCLLVPCSSFFFLMFWTAFFFPFSKQLLQNVYIFQHSFDNVSSCIIPFFFGSNQTTKATKSALLQDASAFCYQHLSFTDLERSRLWRMAYISSKHPRSRRPKFEISKKCQPFLV